MPYEELLSEARVALRGAGREPLGELIEPRRILGIGRAPRIVPRGTAWHLGVLLLTDDDVLATGEIVRSRHEAPRGYTAESQRQRSLLAAAAHRGGIAEGTAVHVGWSVIDPDAVAAGAPSEVLRFHEGEFHVRWNPRGGWMLLSTYLGQRIDLLLDPPGGST